jgi:excisionase family DNA binding protein
MEDTFLTVAELLKLNAQTVRNWIDRGELAAVRVGARRVRVRESELDRFLEAGTAAAPEESSVGGRLDEVAVAGWAQLGIALADATGALEDQDRRKLASDLGSLADASRGLSAALNAQQPG